MTTHGSTDNNEPLIDRVVLIFAIAVLIPALSAFFRAVNLGLFHR